MGSKQKTWSSVFSVTHRSRNPRASARWATWRTANMSIVSGERWGRDMPKAVLSFRAIYQSSLVARLAREFPLPRDLQRNLAEALDDEAHAVTRRREPGGDAASGHHDHAALEHAAAVVEEIREPRHGIEGMAHRVTGLALAAGLVVPPAARHRARDVAATPLRDRRAEHPAAVPRGRPNQCQAGDLAPPGFGHDSMQRVLDPIGGVERGCPERGVERAVADAHPVHLERGASRGVDGFGRQHAPTLA